jgi:hypothetical protein
MQNTRIPHLHVRITVCRSSADQNVYIKQFDKTRNQKYVYTGIFVIFHFPQRDATHDYTTQNLLSYRVFRCR